MHNQSQHTADDRTASAQCEYVTFQDLELNSLLIMIQDFLVQGILLFNPIHTKFNYWYLAFGQNTGGFANTRKCLVSRIWNKKVLNKSFILVRDERQDEPVSLHITLPEERRLGLLNGNQPRLDRAEPFHASNRPRQKIWKLCGKWSSNRWIIQIRWLVRKLGLKSNLWKFIWLLCEYSKYKNFAHPDCRNQLDPAACG